MKKFLSTFFFIMLGFYSFVASLYGMAALSFWLQSNQILTDFQMFIVVTSVIGLIVAAGISFFERYTL